MGPAAGFLSCSTYVEAVCWIGACLADALNYAHQRGLVHLDIKPSNVLLAGDGQPMLLDFHLACEIDHLRSKTFDRLGGTVAYMSPEQRAAAEALRGATQLHSSLTADPIFFRWACCSTNRLPTGCRMPMRRFRAGRFAP